jgi:hypothetical protein
MHPSPSDDTSKPWLPSLFLSIEFLLVNLDLAFDEFEVPAHLGQLRADRAAMLLEERESLLFVAVARAASAMQTCLSRHETQGRT